MRRGIWMGAAIAIAAVVATPLWLVLDDGGKRNQAALTASPAPVLDCSRAKALGCEELNRLLTGLDNELGASIEASETAIQKWQAAIQENTYYKAATRDELDDSQALELQRAVERQARTMATLSNLQKKLSDTQQAIVNNLK
jgi:hypothetical protein